MIYLLLELEPVNNTSCLLQMTRMNKYVLILVGLLYISINEGFAQNPSKLYDKEKEYLDVFNGFKSYIIRSIEMKVDVADTVNMKHVLLNYVMSEYDLDTLNTNHFNLNEIPEQKLKDFGQMLGSFYQYFFEKRQSNSAQHLSAIPLRLSSDKCIYEKLTPFQRENTFVYFDDRYPEKPLGYMLFVPKFKKTITASRIWSWTLQFESGYWAFKSPMGTVGMEYFISEGVKGPKPENRIGN